MRLGGIAPRLALLVLLGAAAVLGGVSAYTYKVCRDIILDKVEENARNQAQATVNRIESVLSTLQKVPWSTAYALENAPLSKPEILRLGRRILADTPEVYATAVAFEPYGFDGKSLYYAPYLYRDGADIRETMLGGDSYRYFYQDWYQLPRELLRPVWTEPYFDEGGGNILMTTYSVPFWREADGERRFTGVVTVDVSLEWLRRIVSEVRVLETGYAFMVSQSGVYVTHPDMSLVLNETIFTLAEERHDSELRAVGRDMIRGGSRFVEAVSPTSGRAGFLFYAPLPSSGWSLGVFYPRDELLTDVRRMTAITTGLGVAGFLALAALAGIIAGSITRPLRRLSQATGEIAAGNLDAVLPEVKRDDEVRDLTRAFGHMTASLKDYIRDLTSTTAAKERIESELRIAHDIQMGILPKIFPPFPQHTQFDIFAGIVPAREVGGDLYDFFLLGEDRFCFLVGDVSGKGVPAAFFMAVAKTLMKAVADQVHTPGEILSKVNDDLAEENDSCMFVTIFCAVLNFRTGEVEWASAGHNPPVFVRAGGETGWLPVLREPVAGAMPGVRYTTERFVMNPGDTLFVYTDGVTEAMNGAEELYGEDRLLQTLAGLPGRPAREVIDAVGVSVAAFTGGAEQSDDITMLALRFQGGEVRDLTGGTQALRLPAVMESLEPLRVFVIERAAGHLPPEALSKVELALEEALVNIFHYAYPGGQGEVEVACPLSGEPGAFALSITDWGGVYDPLSEAAVPDLTAGLDEREPGGLGVFFIKTVTSHARYERRGEANVLVLAFG
ncbi:MAG TPA: SpoIIE family protein phosphatase [Desulfovibrio sp.]|jgi:sigma-B regulation protein RsbU (phosphoserine phosphatase)|uniref:SpoIIE family protein phosphatase n=1 Tax=Desulfovibrio TaxID=872 RepID=UPI0003FCEED3|nr:MULTISPECIES: SpoIIE family protein phosphatase [Desulfovibrio]MDY0307582.1 SpoIIE family protein phosphatase [Desulfovibrionaceae bacterium]HMM39112.1 SpoIIE family protein phosphatase [Desulfovibrio sp.]